MEQLQQDILTYLLSGDDNLLDSRNAILEVLCLGLVKCLQREGGWSVTFPPCSTYDAGPARLWR